MLHSNGYSIARNLEMKKLLKTWSDPAQNKSHLTNSGVYFGPDLADTLQTHKSHGGKITTALPKNESTVTITT